MKRQRGRSRRNNNNHHNANRSMKSNGPENQKPGGTAKQIFDKYENLARDAASSGNRVAAENFRQHAEHYLRIVNAIEAAKEKARAESEAARNEANAESSERTEEGEQSGDKRFRRRYPPQVRKNSPESEGESDKVEGKDPKEPAKASDEAKSPDDAPAERIEKTSATSSSRRRKAPSRDRLENEDTAAEAAE